MKRFWVALLAVAMVAGFALSASAADVKFSGTYYVRGLHADNWGLSNDEASRSLYGQRLRLSTEFKIAEGLTLNTRFDALERRWGTTKELVGSYGYGNDDENISFDRVWVSFAVPFGRFDVGRTMTNTSWGTIFGDNDTDTDMIRYVGNFGPWEAAAFTEKVKDNSYVAAKTGTAWAPSVPWAGKTDGDYDNYGVYGKYKWNGGVAGLQVMYTNDASTTTYKDRYYTVSPYVQTTFGPVFVEAEVNYQYGERESDVAGGTDVDINAWSAYVHGKGNIGPAYVGAFYAFVSGEDAGGDIEAYQGDGGGTFDPALILWGEKNNKWLGNLGGNSLTDAQTDGYMKNAHLFQVYAGYKPMPKLDVKAAVSYAMADEEAAGQDDEIGIEADLTAAYKIYDNLTYTVGFGYLWAGDFYKGTTAKAIDDTYLLMHRLDLSF
ncbi:hypothetical protein [Syntrophus aciditrophicus]|uniref:Hypothetical exported protein n=1 Tax=Syntrophus aciditrophicus (strain SB) TaxID=56780 RepID=Q2LWR5_SYNAS|nr:hypothetical protein [Syntrophus aciditrophicus]ABC78527.1 hypothetical exported protein [Syntrophus aciditrophicus SB]